MLPSPGWGPGAPGKKSRGLFSAKGGQQPRTVAAKRSDEVVAPLAQCLYLKRIPCRRYYLAAGCRTDDLIRLLTNVRIHVMGHPVGYRRHPMTSPTPGKAYEVFLATIL